MKKVTNIIKYYQLPILSGILIGTSFIPFPPWAALFCMTPLWIFWVRETSLKKVFIGGWITQFLLTLIGFNWVAYTIHHFGHFPWSLSIIGMLLFCCGAHLYFAFTGVLFWLLHKKRGLLQSLTAQLIFISCTFWLLETYFPALFQWNFGYSWLWSGLPFFNLAEYIGFTGLSFVVVLFNAAFFWALQEKRFPFMAKRCAHIINVFLLLTLLGYVIQKQVPKTDKSANVLIVQANIGNLMKQLAEKGQGFRNHIINEYLGEAKKHLPEGHNVDFMVWPETAFPDQMFVRKQNSYHVHRVQKFITENQIASAIGSYSFDHQQRLISNSFFTLDSKAQFTEAPYSKTHLLAFGEYIPGSKWLPILKKYIPAGEFARGPGPQVKKLNGYHLGPQICYESLFPLFSKKLADQGAQMIVNLTNDSWYGTWQEPYQHLYMTLARAIEYRRPVIRSTNTGISTVIQPNGEILTASPLHKKWSHVFQVNYYEKPAKTFYQRNFWLIPIVAVILLIGTLIWSLRAKFRSH